jgi:hypothetical protein
MNEETRTNLKKGESKLETHALKYECSDRGTWMFVFRFERRLTFRHHPFLPIANLRSCGNQIGRGRGRCGDFGHYRNRQMIHGLVPAATPWLAPRSLYKIRTKGQRGKELNWHPYLLSIQLLRRLPRSR